jgi:16S rRNA C1402 (ribose-2'-O) methylase RsmI
MHVVYDSAEYHEEADVKKGEIILLFYNNRANKHHLDTIRSKQWAANIKNRRAIEQKEKEEWANDNLTASPCCGDCCEKAC